MGETHRRSRAPLVGLVLFVAGIAGAFVLPDAPWRTWVVLVLAAPGGYLLGTFFLTLLFAPPSGAPPESVLLGPVFRGRWTAVNSPSTAVPSHGTHMYAQTYAVDFTIDGDLELAGRLGPFARPADFGSFGADLLSPVDGEVVTVVDGRRDHRARSGLLGAAFFTVESSLRGLGGPPAIIGNHVVVRREDGVHVLLAHARRGSVTVATGDHVQVGQVLALCGNSGSSTQPHLHLQAMTGPDPRRASGLPFSFLVGSERVEVPPTLSSCELVRPTSG